MLGEIEIHEDPVARSEVDGVASGGQILARPAPRGEAKRGLTIEPKPSTRLVPQLGPADVDPVAVLLRPYVGRLQLVDRGRVATHPDGPPRVRVCLSRPATEPGRPIDLRRKREAHPEPRKRDVRPLPVGVN